MEKCRICLKYRKKLLSIYTKVDGITFADMITSIANVKIRDEHGMDNLCRSCREKLTDAYNFKKDIERSEMVLQESSNMKRISFSDLNDIKIKIEIETDLKPVIPAIENISENLFKDGTDCISYNNTVIKKVRNVSSENENSKSLSVAEFLNSIKTEADNDCYYEDYDIGADDDSGSNFSIDMNLALRKTKEKTPKKNKLGRKKCGLPKTNRKNYAKQLRINPIKPKYIDDLRLARTEVVQRQKKVPKESSSSHRNISVCPYCGKLSKSINVHILQHTAERDFKCDLCSKTFLTIGTLNKHKKGHLLTKNFKCELCVAAFNNKAALKNHMIMHRDEKKYVCRICNKAFKRKAILTRHMFTHNFGNKHIQCELCPMTFYTQYNLRHHMRVHTGERPFKCEICSQPYSYKHDFNRHCLKKHGVFLKRRSINVMNEEVLQQERALLRDLSLRVHGVIKDGEIENPFEGPQAALAYEQAIKAIQNNKIPTIF